MLRERQFNRETVTIAGTISEADGPDGAVACEIVDISAGGAKLKLTRPIPQGANAKKQAGKEKGDKGKKKAEDKKKAN